MSTNPGEGPVRPSGIAAAEISFRWAGFPCNPIAKKSSRLHTLLDSQILFTSSAEKKFSSRVCSMVIGCLLSETWSLKSFWFRKKKATFAPVILVLMSSPAI